MKKRKNHSPEFKAKVALEAIRDEMTHAELPKKYGVHPTRIGTWKCAAIENMTTAFTRKSSVTEPVSAADVGKLHSKIGSWWLNGIFGPIPRINCSEREAKNGEPRS